MNIFLLTPPLQVSKIKADEREDLKVLATGVAAALAARKVCLKFWNLLFSSDMKVFNFCLSFPFAVFMDYR